MPLTQVSAPYRDKIVTVDVADVTHFKAEHKYVTAYHKGGELLLSSPYSVKRLAEQLSGEFVMLDRATLVRRSIIKRMEGRRWESSGHDGGTAFCPDHGLEFNVSRRRYRELRSQF